MVSNFTHAVIAFILLCLAVTGIYHTGYYNGETAVTLEYEVQINNLNAAIKKEQELTQEAVSKVSQEYQNELQKAEQKANSTISALSADNKRLLIKVKQSAATTTKDSSGCLTNGTAELDPESAASLIRITQRGDAWIKALQDTIKELTDARRSQ